MKKVVLYEPSIGSNNIGDQIIVDGVKKALERYFEDAFVIELPTHTPLSWRYLHYLGDADMKIVCGSNIIVGKLNTVLHLKQWAVNRSFVSNMGPLVFMGVGSQQYNQTINSYTRKVYKSIMRSDYIHSVRDSYTEKAMHEIGIENVINTACPTMWGLTSEHCAAIPTTKAKNCVFTLTDYKPNVERDSVLIKVLIQNYSGVFFWPQGNGDWKYFNTIEGIEKVQIINPSLEAYDHYLMAEDTDFVGTRLHGGMRAMQKWKRTLIIGVDNRATELNHDFNIPVLPEKEISQLEQVINQENITSINLPSENIRKFIQQF